MILIFMKNFKSLSIVWKYNDLYKSKKKKKKKKDKGSLSFVKDIGDE